MPRPQRIHTNTKNSNGVENMTHIRKFWNWFYDDLPAYYCIPIIAAVTVVAWKVLFG